LALDDCEMSVTLTPRIEDLIRNQIKTGRYQSTDEVLEEVLLLLEARDRRVQQLRGSVAEGFAAIERGEGIELTPESMEERIRRAAERARRGDQPHHDAFPYAAHRPSELRDSAACRHPSDD
jgi:antitoxin ParD1/3/4